MKVGAVSPAFAVLLLLQAAPAAAHSGGNNKHVQHETLVMSSEQVLSEDSIVAAVGDEQGYHLFLARERSAWSWRPLASLAPGGPTEGEWSGYHCVTGTGNYVVTVVAPVLQLDSPVVRDRGAAAYVIEIESGEVRPVVAGVALKYFNPGCGVDDRVTLTRHLGTDQQATEILVIDVATADLLTHFAVPGQLASPVVVGDAVVGTRGSAIERIRDGQVNRIAAVPGQPYMLRPSSNGLAFLTADASATAKVWSLQPSGMQQVGTGDLGSVKIFNGAEGLPVVVGSESVESSNLRVRSATMSVPPLAASRFGHAILVPRTGARQSQPLLLVDGNSGQRISSKLPSISAAPTTEVPVHLPQVAASRLSDKRLIGLRGVPIGAAQANAAASGGPYTSLNSADEQADGSGTPAKCAVPRNHDRRQVPQPNAAQIDWAIQMATRNLLTGSNARPANFLNLGLAAYSPSSDFQRRQLEGAASTVPVPPSVIQGTFAQESAWRHASFRALPGVAGNPLVSDYYGAGGDINNIDYANADCGYGVGQVTTPMTKAATAYTANGKTKVAVDYAENVAASIQFLVDKWNELYNAGVRLNNANPNYLENWYFAIWAYNTGFHADSGTGPWGLGWTNNPMNSDYPPDRTPFLRQTYADAEHPADWPYQERVFGWMETPLLDYRGDQSYANPTYGQVQAMNIPSRLTFCTASNECDPNYIDPTGQGRDYCTRADRQCWWHEPVTYVPDCLSDCAQSVFTVATNASEPAGDDNYPPACNSSLPSSAIIIDELPNPALQVEGCGSRNWSSQGTFELEFGTEPSTGDTLGIIDWHQLGAGFGGHTWFTKNRSSSTDVSHISTGIWTPSGLQTGLYNVTVHIPSSGASTATARYRILRGDGTEASRTVDQHLHQNQWVSLGNFTLLPGAKVILTNLTSDATAGSSNVAFDAVAFVPISTGGSVVSKRLDAVALFDPYQRLDTDNSWLNPPTATHPFRTMQEIYEWANDLTTGITTLPRCLNSAGGALTSACVGDSSHAAYSRWDTSIEAAGDGSGLMWNNEALAETQADWLGFANPRLGAALTSGELGNPEAYKLHQRLRVEFVVDGGRIVDNSLSLTGLQRVGDTRLPTFILEVMEAYQDDYGVALPDLSYTAEDLRLWTHSSTSVDPMVDGLLPGRAYMDRKSFSVIDNSCVRVKGIGGGSIGYRPMLAQEYVRNEVDAWRQRVELQQSQGRAPEAIVLGAREIQELFFNEFIYSDWDDGSLFYVAPPIWTQIDARVCADGSVQAAADNLGDIGWMPDLYVFVDDVAVNHNGSPRMCGAASRACALLQGDFVRFTHFMWAADDPWDQCDFASAGRRNGNPWEVMPWNEADMRPTKVKYCDEQTWTGH